MSDGAQGAPDGGGDGVGGGVVNVGGLKLARVLEGSMGITCASFHASGITYCCCDVGGLFRVVNTHTGSVSKLARSERYGAVELAYSHHEHCVLTAGGGQLGDTYVRYLSLYDNQYLRYFEGHQAPVRNLAMSPINDNFLTSSEDRSVLLWDLCSPANRPLASLQFPTAQGYDAPLCAYDGSGMVFGAAANKKGAASTVRLFDPRNLGPGPFATFAVEAPAVEKKIMDSEVHNLTPRMADEWARAPWTKMAFSPDGNYLLINTTAPVMLLLDAFDGRLLRVLSGHSNENLALGCCWTPDGAHILAGSNDGEVHVWEAASGRHCAKLEGHTGPVSTVLCSPRHELVASTCRNAALWISEEGRGGGERMNEWMDGRQKVKG